MKLENILTKGKDFFKKYAIYPLAFSTLLLSNCKKEEPEIPVSQDYNLIILDQSSLNNISYYSPTTGIVNFQSATNYSVGDIILANITNATPNGFLREVTSVSNGGKTVNTTQATLEQAVKDGNQTFQRQLNPSQKSIIQSVEGVKLNKDEKSFDFSINLNNVVLYDADGNTSTTNDQVVANGYINFNNSFNMNLNIEDHKLKYLSFSNVISNQSNLQITGDISSNLDKQKTIWQQQFGAFVIGFIGPVPVIVTPELDINVNTEGDICANASTSISQDASLSASLIHDSSGWITEKNITKNFSYTEPTGTESMHLKAAINPELNLLLYGAAGPYAGVDAFLRLNASFISPTFYWGVYGGIDADVGVKVKALSKTLVDKSVQVINIEDMLGTGNVDIGGSTTSTMTDSRDGHVYNIVQINGNWWTAENLDYHTSNAVPYNSTPATEETFGLLYSFVESQNACPAGWHLPTKTEWDNLLNYAGGTSVAGGKLKTTGTIENQTGYWYAPNTGATDSYGFSALSGSRYGDGTLGLDAYFWFSGGIQDGSVQIHLTYNSEATSLSMGSSLKSSVRCKKD